MNTDNVSQVAVVPRIPVFFLAAGLGTRLRPLTDVMPKPLVPFLDIPLLIHAYGFLREQVELGPLYINTHYKAEMLESWLKQNQLMVFGQELYVSREENLLGGGGALIPFRPQLEQHEDFILMNADEVIFYNHPSASNWFSQMFLEHKSDGCMASLLVTKHPLAGKTYGAIWTDGTGRILAIGKDAPSGDQLQAWHFLGMSLLNSRIFKQLPWSSSSFDLLREVLLPIALNHPKLVGVYPGDFLWLETGVYEHFYQNESLLQEIAKTHPLIANQLQKRMPRY